MIPFSVLVPGFILGSVSSLVPLGPGIYPCWVLLLSDRVLAESAFCRAPHHCALHWTARPAPSLGNASCQLSGWASVGPLGQCLPVALSCGRTPTVCLHQGLFMAWLRQRSKMLALKEVQNEREEVLKTWRVLSSHLIHCFSN